MKKYTYSFLILFIFTLSTTLNAQDNASCYESYIKLFEKRGARSVGNGVHRDVIITIRKGTLEECYYGVVGVKNNQINIYEMFLLFEDGTNEKFQKVYTSKYYEITSGISRAMETKDGETINVFFIKHLNPKKKKYKRAFPIKGL